MIKVEEPLRIAEWYKDWDESMIWSYFQKVMGEAYAEREQNPKSAIIYVNCLAFAAGEPNALLVQDWYDNLVNEFAIIVSRDESWNEIFEKVGKEKCRCVERYAI